MRSDACTGCTVHLGPGGLVEAGVRPGAGKRTAYALLSLGNHSTGEPVLVHDVIGLARGDTPSRNVSLLQVLDSSRRVIFELVAGPDRRLYLTSPAGGLRATPLVLTTGALVPNDGVSGVAIDVALKMNQWVLVSVNGMRTAAVHNLSGARTGSPRFLAAGVIGYKAAPDSGAITATHAQVSVSTSPGPAPTVAQPTPAPQSAQAAAPQLTSLEPPTVSGRGVVGNTLTASPGSWSVPSATFDYAWQRCDGSGSCTPIDGAQGRSYDLVAADVGSFVRVRVTALAGPVSVSQNSAPTGPIAPAAPRDLTAPSIFGGTVIGQPLTADPGNWSDPNASFAFLWQRCDENGDCSTIDGATGAIYTPSADDLGSSLRVRVTASNAGGANSAYSAPTDAVIPSAPAVVTEPAVSGDATVGSTLTADPGTWNDPAAAFTYAWLRCHGGSNCTTIEGADGATYVLTGDDVGFRIEVTVTAANAGGTGTATSNLVGPVVPPPPPPPPPPAVVTPPSVSGDAIVGSTLTTDPGTWSDPAATFTYAWLRCDVSGAAPYCTPISGDTGTTYTLSADDLGFSIGVEVTATSDTGTGTAVSALLGPVVLEAPPAVMTPPSISGDAIVGSTLTADPGSWSDPTATFSYAWLRCQNADIGSCTAVGGASGTTYTLTSDDLNFLVGVEVTAANAGGTTKAQSALIGPVEPGGQVSSTARATPARSP